jgi:hypothetical protein
LYFHSPVAMLHQQATRTAQTSTASSSSS